MENHPVRQYLHKLDVLLTGTMPDEQVTQCLKEVEAHLIESAKAIAEVYPSIQNPWQVAVDRFGDPRKVANALRMGFLSHRDRMRYYFLLAAALLGGLIGIGTFIWLPVSYSVHLAACSLLCACILFIFTLQVKILNKNPLIFQKIEVAVISSISVVCGIAAAFATAPHSLLKMNNFYHVIFSGAGMSQASWIILMDLSLILSAAILGRFFRKMRLARHL